jgi:TonB-dependent starch-binding outer membrane protein SusC
MKKIFYFLRCSRLGPWGLFLGFFLIFSAANAQNVVTGRITDDVNEPIPGVNVLVKGTSTGTVTDADGNYSISAPADGVLVFSFVGYLTQEMPIANQSVISLQMEPDIQQLQEVVVTGYASQEKKDLTGAVGTVDADELRQIPTGNVTSQMQGRVAGVTITNDSIPGQGSKVRIRGFGSFGNNNPLYIVDGVPTQDISTLAPEDVESLSVLKDAGAASIYGSRASNGVIVITTKKGKPGMQINYNMYAGIQDPGDGPDNLTNTQQYADLQWLVYNNDNTAEEHPVYGNSPANGGGASPTFPAWATQGGELVNTNWYDAVTRDALIMNHDVSLSSGNDVSSFYGGFNWFKQEGITIHNFSERLTARFNSEFNIKNRVTIGENMNVSFRSGNGIDANGSEVTPMAYIYRQQSIIPARVIDPINGNVGFFDTGDYGGTGISQRLGNAANPVAFYERNQEDRNQDIRLIGSIYADVKIIEGLNFRTTFGGTMQNGYNTNWTGSTYENAENIATANYSESAYYNYDWVWTNTLTFERTMGDHRVLAVAGYEAVRSDISRNVFAQRAGYFSENFDFRTVGAGANITGAASGFNMPINLESVFIRGDYAYRDKYLFSATVRRDGSSRFGVNNQYGTFPSFSAGWRISDEQFLQDVDFLTELKIRGGYGEMGNQLNLSPANQYTLYGGDPSTSYYDITGSGSGSVQGFRPTRIGNPDAKWETNTTVNVGIDAAFFDNKLEFIVDWYKKTTEDLLYVQELPGIYGGASAPARNIAGMENTGVDIQMIYRNNFSQDLRFEGNLTFTTYENEIVKLAEGIEFFDSGDGTRIGTFNRNEIGRSLGEFYGYQVIGLFQNDAEVASAATQEGAEPGFFRYADINNDGVISPEDRTYIGDPNPDFTMGLNLSLTYRNFDVTAFFYAAQGAEIFNYNKWWIDFWPSFQGIKSTDLLDRSWTPERTNTSVPKASDNSNFSTNTVSNSYYIEDASFVRLKNLQIGYNVPASVLSNIGLTRLRVYLQGVNLFTITDYTGLDPELTTFADTNPGVDEFNNPTVKQFLIGLNVGF